MELQFNRRPCCLSPTQMRERHLVASWLCPIWGFKLFGFAVLQSWQWRSWQNYCWSYLAFSCCRMKNYNLPWCDPLGDLSTKDFIGWKLVMTLILWMLTRTLEKADKLTGCLWTVQCLRICFWAIGWKAVLQNATCGYPQPLLPSKNPRKYASHAWSLISGAREQYFCAEALREYRESVRFTLAANETICWHFQRAACHSGLRELCS